MLITPDAHVATHLMPGLKNPSKAWQKLLCVKHLLTWLPAASRHSVAQRNAIKQTTSALRPSHGRKAERAEMKGAVAMGKQTSSVKVSGGAVSIPPGAAREEGRHGRPREVPVPFSKALFGMRAFYVVRKHTVVRHNKCSDWGH